MEQNKEEINGFRWSGGFQSINRICKAHDQIIGVYTRINLTSILHFSTTVRTGRHFHRRPPSGAVAPSAPQLNQLGVGLELFLPSKWGVAWKVWEQQVWLVLLRITVDRKYFDNMRRQRSSCCKCSPFTDQLLDGEISPHLPGESRERVLLLGQLFVQLGYVSVGLQSEVQIGLQDKVRIVDTVWKCF